MIVHKPRWHFNQLVSGIIGICCSSTKYAVMEALGQMSPLLSDDRISKSVTPVISMLITLYKRSSHVIEPYHVT